jgi:hypothetical protein
VDLLRSSIITHRQARGAHRAGSKIICLTLMQCGGGGRRTMVADDVNRVEWYRAAAAR